MFFKGSRYERIAEADWTDRSGRTLRYKRTRFLVTPPGLRRHVVLDTDRTDLIAQRYFLDPERYWRICDANVVRRPSELVRDPGRDIAIPSPTEQT